MRCTEVCQNKVRCGSTIIYIASRDRQRCTGPGSNVFVPNKADILMQILWWSSCICLNLILFCNSLWTPRQRRHLCDWSITAWCKWAPTICVCECLHHGWQRKVRNNVWRQDRCLNELYELLKKLIGSFVVFVRYLLLFYGSWANWIITLLIFVVFHCLGES